MITPIKDIVLKDKEINGTHISVIVRATDNGNLIIDGYDTGRLPELYWGDWDYEYITTVRKDFKDTVLLLLIKDRFKDCCDFRSWLEVNHIPNEFFTWA